MTFLQYLVLIPFLLAMLFIFAYSLSQVGLVWAYFKAQRRKGASAQSSNQREVKAAHDALAAPTAWPVVTVQLPVYNERYVIERLMAAVVTFDYPKANLEIQLLDDSTDDTVDIIARRVAEYRAQGFDIRHIRRSDRTGFKAGALAHGLTVARGNS
ncbi:glycosyltransferase [Salmonirosea aquatica]|uniref:glycosyltransferase n=1 Tax=Salmonirosea aquatica TaxID=2654236 RepID=UPI003570F9C1